MLFLASSGPGSCFCPQDVVEEAVLLLLITESMVRHTFTLFLFVKNTHIKSLLWPPAWCLSSRVERRSSVAFQTKQKLARPACRRPPLSMTCSQSAWPGGGSMPCFLRSASTHPRCGGLRERWQSDKCLQELCPCENFLINIPSLWAKGIWCYISYPFWIPPSIPLQLHPRITWALVAAACLTESQKFSCTPRKSKEGTISEKYYTGQSGPPIQMTTVTMIYYRLHRINQSSLHV